MRGAGLELGSTLRTFNSSPTAVNSISRWPTCAYVPWGCIVRVGSQTKSKKNTHPENVTSVLCEQIRRLARPARAERQGRRHGPFKYPPNGGSIQFRVAPRTYAPCGPSVRVLSLAKSGEIPTRKICRLSFCKQVTAVIFSASQGQLMYALRAVQFHPHGGQPDSAWLPARTPHGDASYVW